MGKSDAVSTVRTMGSVHMDAALSSISKEPDHSEPGRSPGRPEPGRSHGRPEHNRSESEPDYSQSESGYGPPDREPDRSPGQPKPGRSESDSSMVPRWLEVELEKLLECETAAQAWDSDNPRFSRTDVIGKRITLTSVRDKPSDHIKASYAIIGFRSETLGYGQFKIGGNAARQAIRMRDAGKLPIEVILRHKVTSAGRDFYKWTY